MSGPAVKRPTTLSFLKVLRNPPRAGHLRETRVHVEIVSFEDADPDTRINIWPPSGLG
jgi:hypothetical protein